MLQDAEGTVIRANFGSGAGTEDRFENAGTRAAALAESEMSPMALVSDVLMLKTSPAWCSSPEHHK